MEALAESSAQLVPAPDTGTLAGDLEELLGRTVQSARAGSGPVLAGLMAEAQLDPEFARSFRAGFLAARRAVLRSVLERAVERGEIGTDEQGWSVEAELVAEVFLGTLWYRVLSAEGPLDRAFADSLVRTALALVGVRRG